MDEAVLRDILRANPGDESAAEALTLLLTKDERYDELVQLMLDRLEEPGAHRNLLYRRLAELLIDRLQQPQEALIVLLEGLSETGDDALLGDLIETACAAVGEWQPALEVYEQVAHDARNPEIHRRLVRIYQRETRPDDEVRHREFLAGLVTNDPQNASALAAHYEDRAEWTKLVDLLKRQLEKTEAAVEREALIQRIGYVLETRLREPLAALRWNSTYFLAQPTHQTLVTLLALGEQADQLGDVAHLLEQTLVQPSDDMDLRRRIHLELGHLYSTVLDRQGDALPHLQRALSMGPWQASVASAARDLARSLGDWDKLALQLEMDLAHLVDAESRLPLLRQQIDLLGNRLNRKQAAIEACYAALEIENGDKAILVELMDLFRDTESWDSSIKVLKKLTSIEDDPIRRAQYFYAIGVIQRDKLNDTYNAVRSFDLALDFDPSFLRAFRAIDEVLSDEQNFERQDRYYRKMLLRSMNNGQDSQLIVQLASNLARINRDQLANLEEANKAYEIALRYGASERELLTNVAEVKASIGRFEEAAAPFHELLEQDPTDIDAANRLVDLYLEGGQIDDAFCVCRLLSVLGRATDEQRRFMESVQDPQRTEQVRPLPLEAWALVTRGFELPELGELLKWLTPALLRQVATPAEASATRNPESHHAHRLVGLTASILQLPVPDVRLSDRVQRVEIAHLKTPALYVSPNIGGLPRPEQLFAATRALFLLDHRHYLATVDLDERRKLTRLRAYLATVHEWLVPDEPRQETDPRLLQILNESGSADRNICMELMAPLFGQNDYGLNPWLRSVERSANRVAFALSDDLPIALQLIRQMPYPLSSESANERILDLLRFSVSESYRSLRKELRISIA